MFPPKIRFPPIPVSEETPTQRELHSATEKACLEVFGPNFNPNDENGALTGPFMILLRTPSLLLPYIKIAHSILTIPTTPPGTPLNRELITLATLSHTGAVYAIHAHTIIATSLGLSASQISDALNGRVPEGLTERDCATYRFALEVARGFGKVEDSVFEEAKGVLGEEGCLVVTQVVAWYFYNSVVLSAGGVGIPGEGSGRKEGQGEREGS